MRRGTHLRLDRRARAADRLARSVGMRFVHRATDPVAMRGTDPREGFLVSLASMDRLIFFWDWAARSVVRSVVHYPRSAVRAADIA